MITGMDSIKIPYAIKKLHPTMFTILSVAIFFIKNESNTKREAA
jgi:hypothetical protein